MEGSSYDYNDDTFDDHDNGIWRGWVRMTEFTGDIEKRPIFFDLDAKRGTLFLIP
jgi:hypothetical protein